jgi:predicted dehydrogenase
MDPHSRRRFLWHTGVAAALTSTGLAAHGQSSPEKRPVRIGIVGGGFGATFQWHLHPQCQVVAVCDLRPDRMERLASVYRCGNTYRSFQEMLKHPGLDAVGIFTPAPLHAWMSVEAMRRGKHVISAVPAGLSEPELENLLETVRSTGMKYMMAETSYYRPEIMTCREWARQGQFGTIFYSESEYHHEGLLTLMFDDRGLPTWRHGFPPMWYPTHCTGMVVPVTGERLVEVQAIGWGDKHEILHTNAYQNPFWNTTALFKTAKGHASRIAVYWHVAAGGTERGAFYGNLMSYIMERPEGSPNMVARISKQGATVIDANGYPEGDVKMEPFRQPDHLDTLPPSLRVKTGHGNSHTFLTHEFISAILEDRHPAVNIYEAIAYTLPGLVAHESAVRGGELRKIKDYGRASS